MNAMPNLMPIKSFGVIFVFATLASCSTAEREYRMACEKGDEVCKAETQNLGVAGGIREAENLTQGFTAVWWSIKEDFFVAGLHRDNEPEPPQIGVYFGSLSDNSKRTTHWFTGEAPGGEDLIGIRVYQDEKSKPRIYFLAQLQNAGFYFPAFYHFNNNSLTTTSIYSRINCEQLEDVEFKTSGLDIRCRKPSNAEQEVIELSFDVDPSVTRLEAYGDEKYRDWVGGDLRSCVQIKGKNNLCYPVQ